MKISDLNIPDLSTLNEEDGMKLMLLIRERRRKIVEKPDKKSDKKMDRIISGLNDSQLEILEKLLGGKK